jgi:hypothetical protein
LVVCGRNCGGVIFGFWLLVASSWPLASCERYLVKVSRGSQQDYHDFFWFDVSNKSTANNFDKVEARF